MCIEAKLKHLEMIQGVINRMASNSFLLKGWSVTITAALFALAAKDAQFWFAAIAILPATMFWGLDTYFLRQERLFRALFNEVRQLDEDKVDFSMDTRLYNDKIDAWSSVLVSITLRVFHGALVAAIILTALVIKILG